MHEHGDRFAALARALECVAQLREVALAADEELAVLARDARRLRVERMTGGSEWPVIARRISVPLGRLLGIAAQQVAAELVEVVGNAAHELARRAAARALPSGAGSRARVPSNGSWPVSASYSIVPTAYQSLAVRDGFARGLLGRHVRGRSEHAATDGALGVLRFGIDERAVADQTEVEHDHAAFGRDQHVARLDVAMQLAGVVQRGDRFDQLAQARGAGA